MDLKCPTCGKAIFSAASALDDSKQINTRFFPFCSERCRLVDLGAWLDGDYCIPAHSSSSPDAAFDNE